MLRAATAFAASSYTSCAWGLRSGEMVSQATVESSGVPRSLHETTTPVEENRKNLHYLRSKQAKQSYEFGPVVESNLHPKSMLVCDSVHSLTEVFRHEGGTATPDIKDLLFMLGPSRATPCATVSTLIGTVRRFRRPPGGGVAKSKSKISRWW